MSIIQVSSSNIPSSSPTASRPRTTRDVPPASNPWPVITCGLIVIGLFFGALGTWAAKAPLSGAVVSSGTVRVVSSNKIVEHLDGGIVKDILVRDGDHVVAGQVLMHLDDVQAKAAVTIMRSEYLSQLATLARLEAERDNLDVINYPPEIAQHEDEPDVRSMVLGQNNLFEGRRKTLDGQVQVLRKQIGQLEAQSSGADLQRKSQNDQLALIQEQLDSSKQLYQKGLMPKTEILALQRSAAALVGQSGEYKGSGAAIQQAIGASELQILQLQKERLQEISQQFSDTQDKKNEALTRLEAAEDVLNRTTITAPESGTVLGLSANTIGGVVERGQKILQVVPSGQPLEIVAAVRPEDIADISAGLKAEVRLTAYNQRSTPTLYGTVQSVSADRIASEADPRGHYEMRVTINPNQDELHNLDIIPGMPAIVSVATKPRTVLEFFIGPFTDYFSSAMREK